MSTDMDRLRELTGKLDEWSESIEAILDDIPSLVCIWKRRRIVFANRAFTKLLGAPRNDIVDSRWVDFIDPADAGKIMEVADEGASFAGLQTRWRDKSGNAVSIYWLSSWPPTTQGYLLAVGTVRTPTKGDEDDR